MSDKSKAIEGKVPETVVIYEDWAEIEGAVWYKWKVEGDKEWHWERTPYKQKPVVHMKYLPREEYELIYGDRGNLPKLEDGDRV